MAKQRKVHSDPWDTILPSEPEAARPDEPPAAAEPQKTADGGEAPPEPGPSSGTQAETGSIENDVRSKAISPPRPKGLSGRSPKMNDTFYLDRELLEKVRDVAYWERFSKNEFVAFCLRLGIAHMEKERGRPYEPRPGSE